MPTLYIPAALRRRIAGAAQVDVPGATVREALHAADRQFPGLWRALTTEDGELRPELVIAVDDEMTDDGLQAPLQPGSEIHIIPALGGGS
ncbi:MAG: MoaD/ThiS family protein [Deltaproteobacteria bacterium]